MNLNNLFGYVNPLTDEWTNGILANIVINEVEKNGDYQKWIVLDGPGDSLWIENLNTVLDENRMLCMANGQRIKLP